MIDVAEGGSRLIEDQGGLTRWGISQKAYPTLDIASLSRQHAESLYLRDYWQPIRGNALPPQLAFVLFDTAVNICPGRATRILQASLRITQDGVFGPETLAAAKVFLPRVELVARFLEARNQYYEWLAQKDPAKHLSSLHGWRMRVMRLALEAGRWRGL